MKIAFYNPYFDAMGGGERYILSLASHWQDYHSITIFWDNPEDIKESQKRFKLDLSKVIIAPNVFKSGTLLRKLWVSSNYDLIVYLSDGSIPTSYAKYNILHFQMPFDDIAINRFKFSRIQSVICNSEFTKKYLYEPIKNIAQVIYPPVDIDQFHSTKKNNLILTVGRFTTGQNVKNQDVMIDVFKKGYDEGFFRQYKFILAGSVLPKDREIVQSLKNSIHGYPIQIIENCSFEQLVSYYAKAKIYWHAAGFKQSDPKLMEHFGITTVEAMASGCVPIVFSGGGLMEIVNHGKEGLLWNTKEQLLTDTVELFKSENKYRLLQKNALLKAGEFSRQNFNTKFDLLLRSICNNT